MDEQKEFISALLRNNPKATIIGSLGTISSDLETIPHKGKKYLTKGMMGCVLGMALGYALYKPKERVICIIGDGSFLMKMGSISTIMRYNPKNLRVYIINNDSYKSCGGQKTNFKYIKNIKLPDYFKIYDIK